MMQPGVTPSAAPRGALVHALVEAIVPVNDAFAAARPAPRTFDLPEYFINRALATQIVIAIAVSG